MLDNFRRFTALNKIGRFSKKKKIKITERKALKEQFSIKSLMLKQNRKLD